MQCFPKDKIFKGRYKVIMPLGKGAMSAVYLVEDLDLPGARWALKELDLSKTNNNDKLLTKKLFEREAAILASLNHPGLPSLIDFYQDENDLCFLVMEKVHGTTIDEMLTLHSKPLRPQEAIPIILQAAHVLDYLHSLEPQVIFRDLKPSNLMLAPTGRVRFIDFGIARFYDPKSAKDTQELGTPGYCAPEQYHGNSTPQSDIYSLGVTLYYLLTLKDPQPFYFNFPPLSDFCNAPTRLVEITAKCLELEAKKRYLSARELSADLEEVLHTIPYKKDTSTQSLESSVISLAKHVERVPLLTPTMIKDHWINWAKTIFSPVKQRL